MKERTSPLFIDKFETLRHTLLQLFVYGCYDGSQSAENQNVSGRKYSDDLKRVHLIWPDYIHSNRKATGKKINRFPFQRYDIKENYLNRAYQVKSFSPQNLNLYFFILLALGDEEELTIAEIRARIIENALITPEIESYDSNDEQQVFYPMLRNQLESMTALGFLYCTEETPRKYRLAADVWKFFSSDELSRIHTLLSFYRDISPLPSIGYQVQWLLDEHISFACGDDIPNNSPLQAEDIFLQNILNDEIFYDIITAIEKNRFIDITLRQHNEVFTDVVPLKIIVDCQYGRQFLFGASSDKSTFIRRLDQIYAVYINDKQFDRSEYSDSCKILKEIWSASLYSSRQSQSLTLVEIDFFKDDGVRFSSLKRLDAEKGNGKIKKLSDEHWIFSVKVRDPYELIPWIRSFGRCAKVRPSEHHQVANRLNREWRDLRYLYSENVEGIQSTSITPIAHTSSALLLSQKKKSSSLFHEYRNRYIMAVHEIIMRMRLDGIRFTDDTMRAYLNERAFNLPHSFSAIDYVLQNITKSGGNIKEFSLFRKDSTGRQHLSYDEESITNEIPFLMTTEEKRWLRTLAGRPLFQKIAGDEICEKLKQYLNVTPYAFEDIIVSRNYRNDGDTLNDDLLRKIYFLTSAIIERKVVLYHHRANSGTEYEGQCLPIKICFSPYTQRFQLDAIIQKPNSKNNFSLQRMNIKNLSSLSIVEEDLSETHEWLNKERALRKIEKPLKLLIRPINGMNDIERCFLLFSINEKEGWYEKEKNVYHLNIWYYSFEVPTLIRKILSLGKAALVLEPETIREDLISRLPEN